MLHRILRANRLYCELGFIQIRALDEISIVFELKVEFFICRDEFDI
jgi:hypothetical protein